MEILSNILARSIISIVSGMVVGIFKGIKNFIIKNQQEEYNKHGNSLTPIQPVMIVANNSIIIKPVPLNSEVKDLLEIPNNFSSDNFLPKLIVAGKGLVKSNYFVDSATYRLLEQKESEHLCDFCKRKRSIGGYVGEYWYCIEHLPNTIKKITTGEYELPWNAYNNLVPQSHLEHSLVKQFFSQDIKDVISSDPVLSKLGFAISKRPHATTQKNTCIPKISGSKGSEELFVLDIVSSRQEMIITLHNCQNDVELFLGFGYIPTLNEYYKKTDSNRNSMRDKLLLVTCPHPRLWYIMLYAKNDYYDVSLSVSYR